MKAQLSGTRLSLVDACLRDKHHIVRRPAENDDSLSPMVLPTIEGKRLAEAQTSAITSVVVGSMIMLAVLVSGIAFGMLLQQTIMDARAYEMERRV